MICTNQIPATFHNLRRYDDHDIMQEIGMFEQKLNVISNGMEKYMSFTLGKLLVFITSMQFINSSQKSLVKNLSKGKLKYLSHKFQGKQLQFLKQNIIFPYDYMNSFATCDEEKWHEKNF